jgi:spermidine dehydrogenase
VPFEEDADVVVVGAGISGLASAWFLHLERPELSILLLDNHDDFGGHAKRNEFDVDGRFLLGYGGSEAIQSPDGLYSEVAKGLLRDLGIEYRRFERYFDRDLYPSLGMSRGVFFSREGFREDRLVTGDPMRMVADDIAEDRMNARTPEVFIEDFPVPAASKAALVALYTSDRDPLGAMPHADREAFLCTISYRAWIQEHWGLDDVAADTFQGRSHDFFARGVDSITAFDAFETGYPGFAGLGLTPSASAVAELEEPYIYHFPDGNASIARMLVRSMVPAVAPGSTMEDVVTAPFDYGKLDLPGEPVRLRLRSTVVHVENRDGGVRVGYVRDGELHRVRARGVILAGYHMMVPLIAPELDDAQRSAFWANVKAPLCYVKVAVRDWQPWVRLGVHEITNPIGFFSRLKVDYPVSIGDYRFPSSPDEPMVLHLVHVPTVPHRRLTTREQFRAARAQLYAMRFEDFEAMVRDELSRMLGSGGFDADRDIAAITVNRWGHGYSFGGDELYEPLGEGPTPYEIARVPVGKITIANADASWTPFVHAAIDEGHRAAAELLDRL